MAEIHEFSTGIRVEYRAGGGYQWISRGFTGQWMNSTLAEIPYAVDQSIKNEQFAVSGVVSPQNPAIVGRVVFDSRDQEHWSVVAMITYGLDDTGRDFPVYRYFLCKGREGIGIILAWINEYKQRTSRMPFFNPGERKTIGQPNEYTGIAHQVNLDRSTRELLNDTIPIIVAPPKRDLAIVNEMAVHKNSQSASWAYNVESTNHAEYFTIIQAASDAAYNRLLQNKQNSFSGYYLPPGNGDTQAINSSYQPVETIKEVIRKIKDGNRVELTDVQALANVIESINQENWYNIFDDLGARDAIKNEIKMPEMVRILTLRAMIIPETLPEYLDWLSIEGSSLKGLWFKGLWSKITRRKKRENAEQAESRKFQSQIITYLESFPIYKKYLVEGIKIALNKVRREKFVVEATWLLKIKNGAWSFYRTQIIEDTKSDLELVASLSTSISHQNQPVSAPNYLCGNQIWVDLQKFYSQGCKYKVPTYKNFAELFERLSLGKTGLYAQFSAYFYQVSYGHVPKKVFTQAGFKEWRGEVFGLKVDRKVTLLEKVLRFVDEHFVLCIRGVLVIGISIVPLPKDPLIVKSAMIVFAVIFWSVERLTNNRVKRFVLLLFTGLAIMSSLLRLGVSFGHTMMSQIWPIPNPSPPPTPTPVQPPPTTPETDNPQTGPLANFNIISKALKQIVADLKAELPQESEKEANANFSEKIVIHGLREVLDRDRNKTLDLQYGGAIKDEFAYQPQKLRDEQQKWVDGISSYQQKNLGWQNADGTINIGEATAKALKEDIRKTRLFNFAQRTKPALEQMISELQDDPNLSIATVASEKRKKIINAIKKTLGLSDIDNYAAAVEEGDKNEIDKIFYAIDAYQSKFGNPDGIIDANKTTYNKLKSDVTAKLQSEGS